MNKIINKVGVSVLAMVFAVSAVSASTASAATVGELQTLIAQLTAQIAGLSTSTASDTTASDTTASDTTAMTTTTGYVHTGVEKDFTFGLLKVGSRGEEVKSLQKVINTDVDGNFGPGTKKALIAWQGANGLVADGFAGAATKAELNKKTTVTVPVTVPVTVLVPVTVPTDEDDLLEGVDDLLEGVDDLSLVSGDKLVVSGTMSDDMIVGPSQKVIFSKVTLTAGNEDIKVKDINVEFTGTAHRDVINQVLLLDEAKLELESDSIDSSDEAKLDADIIIKDGESVVVYIAALMSSFDDVTGSDGLEASVKVTSITTDGADVEGDSVKGATHQVKDNISVDKFHASIVMEESDVKIGEEGLKIATVNVENKSISDDAEFVKSIELERTGDAGDDALENVEIKVNGKIYEATQYDEDYVFNFGDGIELEEKSDDEDFSVYVDVVDDAGDNFAFKIKDIVVINEDGVFLTDDADNIELDYRDGDDEAIIVVSQVVIDSNTDVSSEKVSAGENSVDFASFDVEVTGSDVEGDLEVTFTVDGVGEIVDIEDIDLNNLAIYDEDGDRVSDREDTSFSTPEGDQATYVVKFDDVKFEHSIEEVDFVIRGDVDEDATDGSIYKVTKIEYVSVEDENGDDVTVGGETISSPSAIEVEGATISVSIQNADDSDINSDTDDVVVAEIELDVSDSGDDIKVSRIKLEFAVISSTADLDDLRSCELFDSSDDSVSDSETAESSVTYNTDITLTKDTENTLFVKCDVGSDFVNDDTITVTGISFDAEGENTGIDLDVDFDDVDFKEATTVTITDGTTEFTRSSDDTNDDKLVRDNANNIVLGHYEFKAKDAELEIDTITATFNTNVSTVIEGKVDLYINGVKEESENPTNVDPSVVSFISVAEIAGKDDTVIIEIKGDVELADAGIQITSLAMTTKEGVLVAAVTGTAGADQDTSAPLVTVVEAIPVITRIEVDSSSLGIETDKALFAYSVKAEGDDVTLETTRFNVNLNNVKLENAEVKVYDNSSMTGSSKAEVSITQDDLENGVTDNAINLLISENDTYYVFLVADVTVTEEIRSISVTMADDVSGVVFTGITGDKVMEGDMKSLLKED